MSPQIINTERYPLDRLQSTVGRDWLRQVGERRQYDGSCTLHYGPRVAEIEASNALYPDEVACR